MRAAVRAAALAGVVFLAAAPTVLAAQSGPPSSSFATAGEGVAAYSLLLEDLGY